MILSPRTAITIEGNRPVGGAAPSPLLTGLVSYWKLDEVSGTRADSAGANNLTDNGSTPGVAGKISNCASFTAASSQFLNKLDTDNTLDGGNTDFAFVLWVNTTTVTQQAIIDKNNTLDYALFISAGTGILRWEVGAFGGEVNPVVAVNDGAWHQVICWHDSTTHKLSIVIDNGTPVVSGVVAPGTAGNVQFNIGAFNVGAAFFDGKVDEVGRWNLVPDATFRTLIWNGGAGRTWPFL